MRLYPFKGCLIACFKLALEARILRQICKYIGFTIYLFCCRDFFCKRQRSFLKWLLRTIRSIKIWLRRLNTSSWCWSCIKLYLSNRLLIVYERTLVFKTNFEMTRSLVILYFLRNKTSYKSCLSFIIEILIFNCSKIVWSLIFIGLFKSKMVLSELKSESFVVLLI